MKGEITLNKVVVAALVAFMFIFLGWALPMAYNLYAPSSQFVVVEEFRAENTTTNESEHVVYFNRSIKTNAPGSLYLELVPVREDGGHGRRVKSWTVPNRYYRQTDGMVKDKVPLPKKLEPGKYQYFLVMQMKLSNGQVTREFRHWSEPFVVKNHTKMQQDKAPLGRATATPTPTPVPGTPTPTITPSPEPPKFTDNKTHRNKKSKGNSPTL